MRRVPIICGCSMPRTSLGGPALKVERFALEHWMNEHEGRVRYNLAETCVKPLTLGELLDLAGASLDDVMGMPMTYGDIPGTPALRGLLADLYESHDPANVLVMNGAIAANFLVFYSLVSAGDTIISIFPAYEQLYRVGESFGAQVKRLPLQRENGYQPDLEELARLIDGRTRLIVVNNPHNPTGAVIEEMDLSAICRLAESCGAYVLCDEAYRGLYITEDMHVASALDLSPRAIVTGSFAKPFSLAGLRLGWIAAPGDVIAECSIRRDYTTISCGRLDDHLAVLALSHRAKLMDRNLTLLRRNFRILDDWVAEQPAIDYVAPRGGTTAFLHYDLPVSSRELCLHLVEKYSTLLAPGDCFEYENYLRVGFACDTEILRAGLSNLSSLLEELSKGRA
jgi:aspartate/methionine/tyrosine aminotransferase